MAARWERRVWRKTSFWYCFSPAGVSRAIRNSSIFARHSRLSQGRPEGRRDQLFRAFERLFRRWVPLNRFLENHTPWYSVVKGNAALAKRFANVTRIPTVFIFDRQGRLALHFIHRWKLARTNLTMEELHAALRPLLEFTPKIAPTSQSGY